MLGFLLPKPCPTLGSQHQSFTDLHLLATFHPRISVHSLTFEAFCSRTIAGSSHNVEEKKNWDTPSLASSSLTQKAAVPQFLSCCDSHPKDCGLTYAAACQPAAFDTQQGWGKDQEVTLQPRRMSSLQDSEAEAAHTRSSTCCSLHAGNHGIPSPYGKWNREWDRQTELDQLGGLHFSSSEGGKIAWGSNFLPHPRTAFRVTR